jgi:hypothetical protein
LGQCYISKELILVYPERSRHKPSTPTLEDGRGSISTIFPFLYSTVCSRSSLDHNHFFVSITDLDPDFHVDAIVVKLPNFGGGSSFILNIYFSTNAVANINYLPFPLVRAVRQIFVGLLRHQRRFGNRWSR